MHLGCMPNVTRHRAYYEKRWPKTECGDDQRMVVPNYLVMKWLDANELDMEWELQNKFDSVQPHSHTCVPIQGLEYTVMCHNMSA